MQSLKKLPLLSIALAVTLMAAAVLFGGMPADPAAVTGVMLSMGAAVSPEELKQLENTLVKKAGEVVETVQKALRDEVQKFETITGKTNEKLNEVVTSAKEAQDAVAEFKARMLDIEQKMAKRAPEQSEIQKSIGQMFVESDEYKAASAKGAANVSSVKIGAIHKTAIVNATGQNQPLVPDMRVAGIVTAPERRLTVRDLLMQGRTDSNLVQFASESVFTNNAGPQFNSPNDRENVVKGESGITFTLSNAAVATIAHWIPASRQILADAPALQSYINTRLLYGLKLEEEEQLLVGDGTGGNLTGLYTGATAYDRGVSNDTRLDCLLKSMLQVWLSEYAADGIILNPIDWTAIMLLKDTTGRYLFADPQAMAQPRVWGVPVVATNTMTSGNFLTGAFSMAAQIWDREDAEIRVLEQHDDFAVKNMVAIICEERMALTIYRSAALIKGTLPATGT